ncbi:FecR domain-containing protein [Dongia sp.]|uniref:FecR family protein n=1 Tax=Dongia sp. TaxID=1977262 RepID=UPI0035B128F0
MRLLLAAGCIALAAFATGTPALADPVGLVQRVQNAVYGTEPQGARTPKQKRDGIAFEELIETTQDSAIEIGFVDGSSLTIGAEATVRIDRFAFDENATAGEAALTLSRGAFRWITGLMPPQGIDLETPTAVISIRGTNVKLGVRANGDTLLGLEEGAVNVRAKGNGDTASLTSGQSARITPRGIEILDGMISVADAVVDDGWFNAIGRNRGRGGERDKDQGSGN